jgi:predicted Zn-dependent protease
MPAPVPANERVDADRISMLLDKVYRIHPLPPHLIDKDEPYEGIANDYALCFLYLSMQLQDRLTGLDNEIKELEKTAAVQAALARKRVPAPDTAAGGLSEKRAAFSAGFDRIVKNLDRCISLMSWNMQPVQFRHQFLLKYNQPKMAEVRARMLLAADPKNSQLRNLLAQALDAQGKRKEAQELLQKGS